jgi:hypothetical protein
VTSHTINGAVHQGGAHQNSADKPKRITCPHVLNGHFSTVSLQPLRNHVTPGPRKSAKPQTIPEDCGAALVSTQSQATCHTTHGKSTHVIPAATSCSTVITTEVIVASESIIVAESSEAVVLTAKSVHLSSEQEKMK